MSESALPNSYVFILFPFPSEYPSGIQNKTDEVADVSNKHFKSEAEILIPEHLLGIKCFFCFIGIQQLIFDHHIARLGIGKNTISYIKGIGVLESYRK